MEQIVHQWCPRYVRLDTKVETPEDIKARVKDIIENDLVERLLRQKFKGSLVHVEAKIKQAAYDFASELFKNEAKAANEFIKQADKVMAEAEELKAEAQEKLDKADDLKWKVKDYERRIQELKAEYETTRIELEEIKEPDATNRALLRLYDRLNADVESERNPQVKAQRIRSNGMIIAARFGMKAVGATSSKVEPTDFELTDSLSNTDRGTGGFGHTNKTKNKQK
jgi:DNA repair exonuclease SbcCD ATPase subunit